MGDTATSWAKDPLTPPDGFAILVGYHLDSWTEDEARISLVLERRHRNRSGAVHGGVLTTMIDAACGYSGCWRPAGEPSQGAVTLSLTTQFLARAGDDRLVAVGTCRRAGRSIFFATAEVTDGTGQLVALGEGSFKYLTS